MTDEKNALDKTSGYWAWRCGQCNRKFVTENLEDTSMCPYCGSVTIAASEEEFNVTQSE